MLHFWTFFKIFSIFIASFYDVHQSSGMKGFDLLVAQSLTASSKSSSSIMSLLKAIWLNHLQERKVNCFFVWERNSLISFSPTFDKNVKFKWFYTNYWACWNPLKRPKKSKNHPFRQHWACSACPGCPPLFSNHYS